MKVYIFSQSSPCVPLLSLDRACAQTRYEQSTGLQTLLRDPRQGDRDPTTSITHGEKPTIHNPNTCLIYLNTFSDQRLELKTRA